MHSPQSPTGAKVGSAPGRVTQLAFARSKQSHPRAVATQPSGKGASDLDPVMRARR